MNKNLEIILYLVVEMILAFVIIKAANLPQELIVLIGAVSVYFGKEIIQLIKGDKK